MKSKDSDNFFVKIYLDDFDASDYLAKQCGYEVAYKFLKAKANLYFNDEDTCPDDPIAIGLWVSGVKRRTIADREHKQHVSQVRAEARARTIDNKNDNCYQKEQLLSNVTIDNKNDNCYQKEQLLSNVTIDNKNDNCYQKEQLLSNDTINRVNREKELIELNNSLSLTREGSDAQDVSTIDTETSSLNTNTPLNTETPPLNTSPQQQRPTGGATAGVERPTLEQVLEYTKMIGCPESLAIKFFNHYEANGWVTDGMNPRPFRWQNKLVEWKVSEEANAQPRRADKSNNNKQTNKLNVNDEYNDL